MKKDCVYFHTFTDDGKVKYQGEVLRELPLGFLEVQFFSFLTGMETNKEVLDGSKHKWQFYTDQTKFLNAYENNQKEHAV